MKKIAIVYNPESGKYNNNDDSITLGTTISSMGYEVLMCPTKSKKDAVKIVRELDDDVNLVICAGGDGTLNEGITGNLHRKKKLLISQIPIGTVNDVATMYGYTKDIKVNIQKLLNGVIKNVDVCKINDAPFVYVACLGSYLDASYNTPRELKRKFGRIGYLFNAINEIFTQKIKQFDLEYEVDGITNKGTYSFMFITNTSRMGGIDNIYRDVKLDDNKFEVVLANPKTKTEAFTLAGKLLKENVKKMPGVDYYKTDKLTIHFKKVPPSWVIDGEEYEHNTKDFTFTIDKSINMLVPEKNVKKLFVNKE